MLNSARADEFIRSASSEYDVVLFDSAPVLPVTDATVLGRKTDGVVLTYAVGKVFIQHFESGETFLTFYPEKVKAYYAEMFEEGKKAAEAVASDIKKDEPEREKGDKDEKYKGKEKKGDKETKKSG